MRARSSPSRVLLAGVLILGCARALPPPGGERDETPPQIIETWPAEREIITEVNRAVVFRFDERISERGATESILVSPETGELKVERGRREIRVQMRGGWRADQVYQVVLLPGVRDLFGNERREPATLVFSTGPPVPSTAIAGMVLDRITGRPADRFIVEATRRADSVRYTTVGDSTAFFALTHLPAGIYTVAAYVDQNRNRRRDPPEAASRSLGVPLNTERDTQVVVLRVVPSDTTPPRVTEATAQDSTAVRLSTDDHLEPDAPLDALPVALFSLPDSTEVPGPHRLVSGPEWQAEQRARADSARAAADTAAAAPPPPPSPRPQAGAAADTSGGPLPFRELVVLPARPLEPGAQYFIQLSGLTNVSGITGGGGSVEFRVPPRDTTSARPDTTEVRRDTTTLRRDTLPNAGMQPPRNGSDAALPVNPSRSSVDRAARGSDRRISEATVERIEAASELARCGERKTVPTLFAWARCQASTSKTAKRERRRPDFFAAHRAGKAMARSSATPVPGVRAGTRGP